MQFTITAKVQIITTGEDRVLLDKTMDTYRKACNYVAAYVFRTHDLNQASLNKALYADLRSHYGLKSQMAQSVLKIQDSFGKRKGVDKGSIQKAPV